MADKSPPKLSAILQSASQPRGNRSDLYRWMKANFRPLQFQFAEHGPRWKGLVKTLSDAGLTDWNGNPPSPRTAQQTWYRLVKDMQTQAVQPAMAKPPAALRRPVVAAAPPIPDAEAQSRAHACLAGIQELQRKRSSR